MDSKNITIETGICNYHGYLWDVGLINNPFLNISYCLAMNPSY